MSEFSVWWSQPVAALTFSKLYLNVSLMSVYLPITSCTYLPSGLYKCTWALLWPYEQSSSTHFSLPFSEVSCLKQWNTGAMQSLKHTADRTMWVGRLYTYVESTWWGRIHKSSPNIRLAVQTSQCKLHLMMQKEIPDDLLTPREVQPGKASLWTVDPAELLISLAGK